MVTRSAVVLAVAHSGRHLEEVTKRRAPVLRAGQFGNVGDRRILDRPDVPFGDRDADQHCRDRLGHRRRSEAVAVGAAILVALHENGVLAGDEEPGRRSAHNIVVKRK
jgi:hypothetical protein